jgi:periplasmic divalent cation tolerance protein
MKTDDPIVVLVTASKTEEAETIAQTLVEERLAACCNIIPSIRSVYRWEGNVCSEAETLMIIKTKTGLFTPLEKRIRELHSYQVPEIIALPVQLGYEPYLNWLTGEIR